MAAPHVTGICGLVAAQDFGITSLELKTLLRNTADDEVGTLADDPQGYDTKHGYGRANAWSAVIHTLVTPYMRQNQRLSNTYTSAGQYISYRLAPPPNGSWEVAAARPHSSINTSVYLRSPVGTTLASSILTGDEVDFVLARNRPTSGSDYYARIYNTSGSGKYCVFHKRLCR